MEQKKKKLPPYIGDIVSIVMSFVLAGVTIYSSFGSIAFIPLVVFYIFMGILRLIILLCEVRIAKTATDITVRFKRERRILRLTGLFVFLFNIPFSSVLGVLIARQPSSIYTRFTWAIFGFAAFVVIKFIVSIVLLLRARDSYSPYRETICCLSFISALMTLLTLEVTLIVVFETSGFLWTVLEVITAVVIAFVVLILSIVMMIARRVPKELRK